jgi:hypothetical protein
MVQARTSLLLSAFRSFKIPSHFNHQFGLMDAEGQIRIDLPWLESDQDCRHREQVMG